MTITLYKNLSDNKVVSKNIVEGPSYTVTIKRDCSVEEPYFLLEKSTTDIADYNYLYCPDFHRYYYIRKRRIVMGGMFEIECFVDALKSFSVGIRNLQAIVDRQEFIFNPYLEDAGICITQGSVITPIKGSKVGEDTYSIYLTAVGSYDAPEEGGL